MDVKQGIASIIAAHKVIPLANTPVDTAEPLEIVAERTETAKVFDLGNGQRQARIYAAPIHFKTPDGTFSAIDTVVKRKPLLDPLARLQYEVKSGLYHAHFDPVRPWNYRFCLGADWVEYAALFDESASLTIKVETSRVGVKETITLLDSKAPTKLQWRVTKSEGGSAIVTPPPTARDAKGKDVKVTVSQAGDILTFGVDTTGAAFPVVVDPTSVIATSDDRVVSTDATTYLTARNSTSGDNSGGGFQIGQWPAGGSQEFTIMRSFASLAIPDMSAISASSLFLYGCYDQTLNDFYLRIVESSYTPPISNAAFNDFTGWAASGAYSLTPYNDDWSTGSYSDTWNELVFNATGLAAILAAKNSTLKIAAISSRDAAATEPVYPSRDDLAFYTSSTAGKEPYLSITFTPPQVPAPRDMAHYRRRRV